MALNQYSYPQPTGLQQLGEVLTKGSGDYANIQLQRQAEDRRRAQQLADLQDQRLYGEQQASRGIDRQKELLLWQQQQARIRELINKGLLTEADSQDAEKVAAADMADAQETTRMRGQKVSRDKDAQKYVNTLGKQANDIQDEIAATVAALNAIPKSPTAPSAQEVNALAKRMATEAKVDYNNTAIRQQFQSDAEAKLQERNDYKFALAQQAAKGYQDSLSGSRYRLDSITRQLTDMAKQDYFPSGSPPEASPTASLAAPAVRQLREATPEEKAAIGGEIGGRSTATNAPSTDSLNFGDINAAIPGATASDIGPLRQARTAALAERLAVLDAPRDETNTQMASVQQKLQRARSGLNPWQGVTPSPLPSGSPNMQGSLIAQFLLQSKALQDQLANQNKARSEEKNRLLSQLTRPLPPLNPAPAQAPASVFASPDSWY